MRAKGEEEEAMDFEEWWSRTGRQLDPDPDVNWYDKRKDLMAMVWLAAKAQSGNYVADAPEGAHRVTFANGREVYMSEDGEMRVDMSEDGEMRVDMSEDGEM